MNFVVNKLNIAHFYQVTPTCACMNSYLKVESLISKHDSPTNELMTKSVSIFSKEVSYDTFSMLGTAVWLSMPLPVKVFGNSKMRGLISRVAITSQ